jgi:hypothetical protein
LPQNISPMNIRLVSSLTAEDEACICTAICVLARGLLDQFGIAYTLRIEGSDGQVVQQTSFPADAMDHPADLAST